MIDRDLAHGTNQPRGKIRALSAYVDKRLPTYLPPSVILLTIEAVHVARKWPRQSPVTSEGCKDMFQLSGRRPRDVRQAGQGSFR